MLIDSDWPIDALGARPPAVALLARLGGEQLAVSIVSHCELLEGVVARPNSAERVAEVRVFLGQFATIPITDTIAEIFAQARSRLRSEGRLIPDFDLVIAATALAHDLTLVTRNRRHFDRIEGLRLLPTT
ncbi:MAG: type II toxin-antitoxin system VapC family toxin [Chloroflexia bacterium]|nr:type II toxin-antitoxin system VapC family toxin [Chloroflexia bacterium]